GAPDVHHALSIWLLLVADPHHVDHALEIEELGGKGEGASPLAGTGLRRQPPGALRLVVEGLGYCGVRFVRPGRTATFVLVIDLRGRFQLTFQPGGSHQWRRTPQTKSILERLRDVDEALL